MLKLFRNVLSVVLWDWGFLLCFEVIYKTIGHAFIFPLFHVTMAKVLQISGLSFLSQETLYAVMKNPLAILLIISWLLFFSYYFYLEATVIFFYCEKGWHQESFSYVRLLKKSFFRSLRVFQRQNIAALFLYFLFMPLLLFPFSGKNLITLPEYILDFIKQDPVLRILFLGAFILMNYLFFLYLFGLRAQITEGRTFSAACRIGVNLLKRRKRKVFCVLTANFLLSALLLIVLYLIVVFTLLLLTHWHYDLAATAKIAFQVHYLSVQRVSAILSEIFILTVFLSSIIILYYNYIMYESNLSSSAEKTSKMPFKKRKYFIVRRIVSAIAAILLLTLFSETKMNGGFYQDLSDKPAVVAHRAGALFAPENTIAALEETVKSGAEAAEIDIRQTKDDTLILLHDTSLKRIAGINEKVWDLTYPEICNLSLAEPIPTLEQALQFSNRKLDLMLELKVTGHEDELVKKTLDTVKQYGAGNRFSIASMNLATLREVKEIDPAVQTVYITPILFAEQYDLNYVDAFSVETSFLTANMIADAHYYDKKVYVWTINTEKRIKKALRLQPDGIVTDNPYLAKYLIENGDKNTLFDFWTELFFSS